MNIWIIDHYATEPEYNGYARQYFFAKEFSNRGHKVLVVSSAFSHFTHSYITEEQCMFSKIAENAQFAYLHTLSYMKNNSIKRIFNCFSFVKSVVFNADRLEARAGKPDVVIGCSMHPFTWLAAISLAKKYNVKFIAEVRDFWPADVINTGAMSAHNPFAMVLLRIQKYAFDNAEKIIYSMSHGDRYISDILGYPREKILWIPQPVNCSEYDANALRYDELPDTIKAFMQNSFVCVFAGHYMDYEGVNVMLGAAKILRDREVSVKFVFVGSGAEEERMKKYVSDNKLDNVLVSSRIQKSLIPALLSHSNICLAHVARRQNPNGMIFGTSKNKVSEYLYSGGCLVFAISSDERYIEDNKAGFIIEPFNEKAFASRIEEIYCMSEKERNQIGINARKYTLANYSVEKLADKYISNL